MTRLLIYSVNCLICSLDNVGIFLCILKCLVKPLKSTYEMALAACNLFLMKNGFCHGVHLEVRLKSNYIMTSNDYCHVNIINHFVYLGQFQCLFSSCTDCEG